MRAFNQLTAATKASYPRFIGLYNRLVAKLATHLLLNGSRTLRRKVTKDSISKPVPIETQDTSLPADQLVDNQQGTNKTSPPQDSSEVPNLWIDGNLPARPQETDSLSLRELPLFAPRELSSDRIIRYNRREEMLEMLSDMEATRYEQEQERHHVQQHLKHQRDVHPQRRPDSPVDRHSQTSSPSIEDMLGQVYVMNDRLDPDITCEVIEGLSIMLDHIPFAVVGSAALVYYGRVRQVSRITIACPADCARSIFGWAKASGMHRFGGDWRDSFGYKTKQGHICRVRVRPLYEESFQLFRVAKCGSDRNHSPEPAPAKIMALPSLVNEYARLFTTYQACGLTGKELSFIAFEIMWALHRIAEFGQTGSHGPNEQAFTYADTTWLLTRQFWRNFTGRFPESIELFRLAGVFVARSAGVAGTRRRCQRRWTSQMPRDDFDGADLSAEDGITSEEDSLRDMFAMLDELAETKPARATVVQPSRGRIAAV